MRVEDSLERGVSFFMAELQRLKAVVDAATATGSTDRPVLYLLDEILQGTNTAERQIASRQVMTRLCRAQAIGAISSHDLELVADLRLADRAVPVHFAETLTNSASGRRDDVRLPHQTWQGHQHQCPRLDADARLRDRRGIPPRSLTPCVVMRLQNHRVNQRPGSSEPGRSCDPLMGLTP